MNSKLTRAIAVGCLGLMAFTHVGAIGQVVSTTQDIQIPVVVPEYTSQTVMIGNRRVQFQVGMWQNLMPIVWQNPTPTIDQLPPAPQVNYLISVVGLRPNGLPPGLELTGVRIWRGKKVFWKGELTRQGVSDTPTFLQRTGSGFFAVPTNGKVNLTVLFKIGKRSSSVTIPNVPVSAVY